jgi:hypothetical protein
MIETEHGRKLSQSVLTVQFLTFLGICETLVTEGFPNIILFIMVANFITWFYMAKNYAK